MAAALEDRLHQPYREPLVPGFARALALRHPDVIGACLSGAGPSLLAVVHGDAEPVARAMEGALAEGGLRGRAVALQVDAAGATVEVTA